jgi:hypothetical protein
MEVVYFSEMFNHLPDFMVPKGHNMNLQPRENLINLKATNIFLCFLQAAKRSNTSSHQYARFIPNTLNKSVFIVINWEPG